MKAVDTRRVRKRGDDGVGQGQERRRARDRIAPANAGRASTLEFAADAGHLECLPGPSTEAEDWPLSLPTARLPRSVEFLGGWVEPR